MADKKKVEKKVDEKSEVKSVKKSSYSKKKKVKKNITSPVLISIAFRKALIWFIEPNFVWKLLASKQASYQHASVRHHTVICRHAGQISSGSNASGFSRPTMPCTARLMQRAPALLGVWGRRSSCRTGEDTQPCGMGDAWPTANWITKCISTCCRTKLYSILISQRPPGHPANRTWH